MNKIIHSTSKYNFLKIRNSMDEERISELKDKPGEKVFRNNYREI